MNVVGHVAYFLLLIFMFEKGKLFRVTTITVFDDFNHAIVKP